MTVALVVGVGEVGTRAARQLVDTPGFSTILLADRDASRARSVADALGPSVHAIEYTPGDAIPPDVAVIACALPAGVGHDVVAAAIAAGVPIASSDDEHDAIEQLRALDHERAARRGSPSRSVAVSRPDSPTCSPRTRRRCSRTSTRCASRAPVGPGPASVDTVRHERRVPVRAWRDGGWREERSRGDALGVLPGADRRPRLPGRHRRDPAARRRLPERVRDSRCSSASRRGARAFAAGSATKASGARRASRCGASATARTAASPTAWSTAPRSRPARCSRS